MHISELLYSILVAIIKTPRIVYLLAKMNYFILINSQFKASKTWKNFQVEIAGNRTKQKDEPFRTKDNVIVKIKRG